MAAAPERQRENAPHQQESKPKIGCKLAPGGGDKNGLRLRENKVQLAGQGFEKRRIGKQPLLALPQRSKTEQ